jgi:hypothetical protein
LPPLLGYERTKHGHRQNDVNDPKRSSGAFTRLAIAVTDRAMETWYPSSITLHE